jgi:hypothetical protein
MTHAELVQMARKWLIKARQCNVVLSETQAQNGEIPDSVGWRGQYSIKIECKVSRADFRKDLKKWYRNSGYGIGQQRFFMAPAGVIPVDELPPGWGLLEVSGNVVRTVREESLLYFDEHISSAEVPMLVAALRRTQVRKSTTRGRRKHPKKSLH